MKYDLFIWGVLSLHLHFIWRSGNMFLLLLPLQLRERDPFYPYMGRKPRNVAPARVCQTAVCFGIWEGINVCWASALASLHSMVSLAFLAMKTPGKPELWKKTSASKVQRCLSNVSSFLLHLTTFISVRCLRVQFRSPFKETPWNIIQKPTNLADMWMESLVLCGISLRLI